MNIFVLDNNPKIAAEMMCDKHIVKMIIESCQILSAVIDNRSVIPFTVTLSDIPSKAYKLPQYPKAHVKHPCTIWAMESSANAQWLLEHLIGLCDEFSKRFPRKQHKLADAHILYKLILKQCEFPSDTLTTFVQAMPAPYKTNNAVEAYRNYYLMDKTFAAWKTTPPDWFKSGKAKILNMVREHNQAWTHLHS